MEFHINIIRCNVRRIRKKNAKTPNSKNSMLGCTETGTQMGKRKWLETGER